jgi:hypothetical protein
MNEGRDHALTDRLLRMLRTLLESQGVDWDEIPEPVVALCDSILVGDYENARPFLRDTPAAKELLEALPSQNFRGCQELRATLERIRLHDLRDPFEVQIELSLVTEGLALSNIPEELRELQIGLTEEASWISRQRGEARRASEDPVGLQQFEDCWVQALYHLPVRALDTLRHGLAYDEFLARVMALFPEPDIRIGGLRAEHFSTLLERLGLKKRAEAPSENGLAELLRRHGAVMGAIGWFDQDVSEMDPLKSMRFWRQHAIDIIGYDLDSGFFTVRDSLLPHPVHFTMPELDVMSLVVFVIEAAVADPSVEIAKFIAESRAQA